MGIKEPVFIIGPTAVGKSAVALELARHLSADILSADSMQVYRGMDIGTAKIKGQHLVDVCDVGEPFDAKQFVKMAEEVLGSGFPVIICGGTGMYVRALRHGLFRGRDAIRNCVSVSKKGTPKNCSPSCSDSIRRRRRRLIVITRAASCARWKSFTLPESQFRELQTQWRHSPLTTHHSPLLCLTRDRADLIERIERRIDEQMAAGWLDEVRRLMDAGLERNPTAMQAAGYKELVAHLRGELALPAAVALIKIRTRQLAKRQMTWFRKEPDLTWIAVGRDEPPAETATRIMELLKTH